MSNVKISANASGTGTLTIAAPNTNTDRTLTLPDATGTIITTAGGAAISGTTGAFTSTVGVGGATPAASGAGITFPATQSASTDANTLDDYEEGTFTPTLSAGFSVAPTSYTYQLGRYTKIGRVVYFEIDIDPNGATADATQIAFSGLPFAPAGAPYGAETIAYQASFNTNAGDSYLVDTPNSIVRVYTNAGAARAGNAANVNINNRIAFSGWYTT